MSWTRSDARFSGRGAPVWKKQPQNRMQMKQLTEAAGVTKATIQFYIKEGLIAKPIKTYANMAYYDETHWNAIRLVREL